MSNELIRELVEAVEAARRAHKSMFLQCLSNGVFNKWGQQVDCTDLNEAGRLASDTLIAKARAYLASGGWTRVEDGLPVVPEDVHRIAVWVWRAGLPRSMRIHVSADDFPPAITHWRYAEPTPEPPKG